MDVSELIKNRTRSQLAECMNKLSYAHNCTLQDKNIIICNNLTFNRITYDDLYTAIIFNFPSIPLHRLTFSKLSNNIVFYK